MNSKPYIYRKIFFPFFLVPVTKGSIVELWSNTNFQVTLALNNEA